MKNATICALLLLSTLLTSISVLAEDSILVTVDESKKAPQYCSTSDFDLLMVSEEMNCYDWLDTFDYPDGVNTFSVYQLNITNLQKQNSTYFFEPVVGGWNECLEHRNCDVVGEDYWYNCGESSEGNQGYNAHMEQEYIQLGPNESGTVNLILTSAKYNWGARSFDCEMEMNIYVCDYSTTECDLELPIYTKTLIIGPVDDQMWVIFVVIIIFAFLMLIGFFPSYGILRSSVGNIAGFVGNGLKITGFIFGGFLLYKLTKDDDW